MQNKANLPNIQMNVTYVKTRSYEQKTMYNEPTKQSQSKPISSTSAAFGQRELFVVTPGAGDVEVAGHFVGGGFGLNSHRGVNIEAAF